MDLTMVLTGDSRFADLEIDPPGLATGDNLQTALIISLFTYRRANNDDPLSLNENKRGWWGDTYLANRNDKIGSRLWLLKRAKMAQSTLTLARDYCLEATRWLIEDNIATRVDVETEFMQDKRDTMAIKVNVVRPTGGETFNFEYVWKDI